jgi:rubrerythrin
MQELKRKSEKCKCPFCGKVNIATIFTCEHLYELIKNDDGFYFYFATEIDPLNLMPQAVAKLTSKAVYDGSDLLCGKCGNVLYGFDEDICPSCGALNDFADCPNTI